MTNPEAKTQYEGAILTQLVKNAEKLAVLEVSFVQIQSKIDKIDNLETKVDNLETKVDKIYSTIETLKWLTITIGIGIVVNIFSQPVVSFLFQ